MATFRSSSITTYASRTNTTITAPASIADGDILVLYMFVYYGSGATPTVTLPSGFSAYTDYPNSILATDPTPDEQARILMAYKVASGESGDYTVTHSTYSTQACIVCVQSGTTTGMQSTTNTGAGTTSTATGLTSVGGNVAVIFFGACWDLYGGSSAPTGTTPTYTERHDTGELYVATGDWVAGGATGNESHTNGNADVDSPWHAGLVIIENAAAPAGDIPIFMRHYLRMMGAG